MLHQPWFKVFIWFLAAFFFFLVAAVVISVLSPGPSESQIHQFMIGSMDAMDRSMMGAAMHLRHDVFLTSVMVLTASLTVPLIALGLFLGLLIWFRRSLCSEKS